ncbi:MAG: sulfatase-like hydrolase/transferase [Gammaproteobacteria bacterium]|nr:sulfatase-like hydrolase/transferase [Gammaproteobacteria bacterium]
MRNWIEAIVNNPGSRWYELLSAAFIFSILIVLVVVRAGIVDHNIGTLIACPGCFHGSVLQADLVMFWLASGALLLAGFIPARQPGRWMHLSIGLLFVVYLTDLFVFRLFSYRLFLSDAALFVSERAAVWDQFSTGVGGVWVAAIILLAVVGFLVFLFLMPVARGRPTRLFLFAILILSLGAGLAMESPPFVNDWATNNVFSANLSTTERVRYSAEFESKFSAMEKADPKQNTAPLGPQSGRNVVIVLVESWSSWHSLQFGGTLDWTPEFDAAARRGLQFRNFHAIGFSTTNGLVGILGGQKIWSPFLHLFESPPFHSMWGIERTLPRLFSHSGYKTAFLTTGPVSLYRKGEWMSDLGFQYIEGNEHPFYADEERYAFGAPSDAALYQRGLQWMQSASEPFLLVLETVTTHQPYVDPDSGERSLEKSMKFADRAFGLFLEEMEASGFFEQGLLVVASDHRSMTPVSSAELERFGEGTFSRVPAFMIGMGLEPGSVDNRVLSQSDLVPSFEWWLTGTTSLGPHDSVMLDGSDTAKCAFHARGDRRGLLEVMCPEGYAQVRMEGDQTRFVQNDGFDEQRKQSILDTITKERLAGLYRQQKTQQEDSITR